MHSMHYFRLEVNHITNHKNLWQKYYNISHNESVRIDADWRMQGVFLVTVRVYPLFELRIENWGNGKKMYFCGVNSNQNFIIIE